MCRYHRGSRSITPVRYKIVLAEYLRDCKADGGKLGNGIIFAFSDAAGFCPMSSEVAYHWFQVLRAALFTEITKLARHHGFRIVDDKPDVAELLEQTPYPVVEIGSSIFAVERTSRTLFSDHGTKVPKVASLPKSERLRVLAIAKSGRCECRICHVLRKPRPFVHVPRISAGRVRMIGKFAKPFG